MTYTTTTNATNGQCIYLPTNTWGTTYTAPSSWTYSYNPPIDENASKLMDQISKAHSLMVKYEVLINGIIFKELSKKLSELLFLASCQWGQGNLYNTVTMPSAWTTAPTTVYPMPTSTTSNYNYTTWTYTDSSVASVAATALNTGVTYTY